MSDAQPSPETDVRVSWRSWKFRDIANMKFKSKKGPVILWDFGELWKFMADPELIWFSLNLPNWLPQNPTHVTLGFGGWDTHAILHSCGDRGSHLADTLWVAVPAFLKLTVDHRFSFLSHMSDVAGFPSIHEYPRYLIWSINIHNGYEKKWWDDEDFNLRRRFADFFWGLRPHPRDQHFGGIGISGLAGERAERSLERFFLFWYFFSNGLWNDCFSSAMNWFSRNELTLFFDTEFHTEADDVSPDSQDGTLCLGDLNHFCQVKTCLRCKDHFSVRNMLHICRRMKIEMEVWSPVPTAIFASFYLDATGHWGSPLECLWQLDISKSRVQRGRSMEVMWEEMRFQVVFCVSDGRFSLCKPCLVKINFTKVYFQFPISAFHVTTITMMCVCVCALLFWSFWLSLRKTGKPSAIPSRFFCWRWPLRLFASCIS